MEALEELLALHIDAYVFYHPSITIFHPKIYLFEGADKSELIIGSSNLTSHGLFTNVEVSLLVSIDNLVEADRKIVEQLKDYFKGIFDFTDPNLKKINKKIIADLVKANGAVKYIAHGESLGIHKGYKTGIRDDWFVVPSLKISDALFIRRNNLYPRLIINQAEAYTTDTMHRVFMRPNTNIKALTASYYYSLSLAFTEVCGRSHGGGVLELMPNEAERILLPYHIDNAALLTQIDKHIRNRTDIEDILKITNQVILKEHFGLTQKEIKLAHSIWKKLSYRRLNRGK